MSFLKKLVPVILPWRSELSPVDSDEDEEVILNNINAINQEKGTLENTTNCKQPFGQSDPLQFDSKTFKCTNKEGKVTYLCDEYGLIDNVVYFEKSQVSINLSLKLDDEVLYSAYRAKDNEVERVYEVYALKNGSLQFENSSELESDTSNFQKTEQIAAPCRVITGRVTQRRGREVFVESENLWCNLDKIKASFVPIEGDWVELQAVVTADVETGKSRGDALEVISLKPLLMKSGFGRITFWSDIKKEGAIENSIYFIDSSCEGGYVPNFGEEVSYEAVESDQEKFKWRALRISPKGEKSRTTAYCEKNNSNGTEMSELHHEKNGISISPTMCCVEIELNEVKTVMLNVTNNGEAKQFLVRTSFLRNKDTQVKLVSPQKCSFYIYPKQTVSFQFECKGKVLGLDGEIFYFNFKNFVIAKRFEIKVLGNNEMNKLLECKFGSVYRVYQDRPILIKNETDAVILKGPKPWTPPKFISRERKCVFNVPKKLWNLLATNSPKMTSVKPLMKYEPYLAKDLSFDFYTERFHTLLYLEEIELRLNFQKYSLREVYLQKEDNFLVLEVPGLVEKRPSLIVGDKINLFQSWAEGTTTKNVGYIHNIREKEVLLKFQSSFHDTYNGSECDISFEPNLNFFSKTHEAINRAKVALGQQWLFPSAVNEKPPRIDFDVPNEEAPLPGSVSSFFQRAPKNQQNERLPPSLNVTEVESNMRNSLKIPVSNRRVLTWENKALNERQKLAVVNVLRGCGRPLPYIIFGPPGTGKTITLVELVIQIYRLMPDSRILITTPSNSSADLICERLIDAGGFKPGQLVRVLALYRVHDGLVPEKLIPYSTYYNQRGCPGKNCWSKCCRNRLKNYCTEELIGRQRITIATCVAVGFLHYKGFPVGHFTHVLVDEAGQTSEPEVLISATFQDVTSGQVVLVGDSQQLGPVVCSSLARKFGLGISLMQRLVSRFPYQRDINAFPNTAGFDPRFITQFNINYRTVPEILSLPSQMFYNSDLIPTVSQTDGKEATVIQNFNFKGKERRTPAAIIFHGIIGQNYQEKDSPSWFNPHEIWQMVFYLEELYSVGLKSDDIGIVTPYAKQVQKLRNLLTSLKIAVPKIGSVEEFQGQERLVIILSTVRSSPELVESDIFHSLGFVASPQRLNVALTRARALLIIIGNPILLSRDPYWINTVEYCIKNQSYTGCDIDALLGKVKAKEGGESEGRDEKSGGDC